MNLTLIKALVALVPAGAVFAGSAVMFGRRKTRASLVQVIGAGCLVVVVLTHVCEGLQLFPVMQWGAKDSPGHYLDLWSAIAGLTLLPLGFLWTRLDRKR